MTQQAEPNIFLECTLSNNKLRDIWLYRLCIFDYFNLQFITNCTPIVHLDVFFNFT